MKLQLVQDVTKTILLNIDYSKTLPFIFFLATATGHPECEILLSYYLLLYYYREISDNLGQQFILVDHLHLIHNKVLGAIYIDDDRHQQNNTILGYL